MYHSVDFLTEHGVAHLVVHGTSGSTSYETIPPVPLETFGGTLETVDMVVQRWTALIGYATMMMMMIIIRVARQWYELEPCAAATAPPTFF